MPASRLTRPSIAALTVPPGKAEIFAWDADVPGFGVKVSSGGARRYVLQYRPTGERGTKRLTLGAVEALSLDEARREARKLLAQALTGADPHAARAKAKAKPTPALRVVDLVDRYLVDCARRQRESTLYQTTLHLRRHWAPLHDLAADKVKRADVAAQILILAESSGGVSANRSRAALSAMFTWGIGTGIVEHNPVVGSIKATDEQPRHRVLTEAEIRSVWSSCRDDAHGRITRLLLLTAQRRDEVGALSDPEIDIGRALWILPAARSKNRREHHIPLSAPVLEILRETPRVHGRPFLFGERDGGFSGWSRAKAALDARMAKDGNAIPSWTLHDLRRTAATLMADRLGVLPHVVEAILNHTSGHRAGIAGVYNLAAYATEKRAAVDAWAKYLEDLVAV
ncbi:tyrosine-type recombinase/integrase [Methylobacterium sp. NPDC080182]|uniref:tyrosine-type recombinase/integrase n=1 Tax=Methylobacterium sp. NPDC080182 TaxID=3390590 RepID=UPI003D03FAD9